MVKWLYVAKSRGKVGENGEKWLKVVKSVEKWGKVLKSG